MNVRMRGAASEDLTPDAGPLRVGARAGLVRRTRLVDELGDASSVPVVLVVGGAGYGKTTLAAQ
jgi:ATP/maltotriose-dependent transcriptional regulator MalT